MATIRLKRTSYDHFTIIPNALVRDPDVSANAVKLYGFLNSHSSGWVLNTESIAKALGKARSTVSKAFTELEALGYVQREWVIEGGLRQGVEYCIYDTPQSVASEGPVLPDSDDCSESEQPYLNDCSKNGQPKKRSIEKSDSIKKNNSLRRTTPLEEQKDLLLNPGLSDGDFPGVSKPSNAEIERLFLDWYTEYPRKRGKNAARKAYERVLPTVGAPTLLEATQAFRAHCERIGQDPKYIPHPATWLNQGRWDDELDEQKPASTSFSDAFQQVNTNAGVIDGEIVEAIEWQ